MSAATLPPPPLGRGLAPWHLALAALGSSGLTAVIVLVGLAGRGEEVERHVRRGIEGGVEQALAPAVLHDRSAVAGRGLVEGLVDGALDQVAGPRADAVLGRTLDAGGRLAETGLDASLRVGLDVVDALGAPAAPPPGERGARLADAVAPVDSARPPRRATVQEVGRLAEDVMDLGFGLVDDVLGARPRARPRPRPGGGDTGRDASDEARDDASGEDERDRDR